MSLNFDVYGLPAPQGSKRHVGNGVMVESSKNVKPWREAVKHAALDTEGRFGKQPVAVWVTFYLPRPRGHFRTGKHANELRPAAPGPWPMTKPDVDKLVRSTCDALKDAGVYHDDACVAVLDATKVYADHRPPGANVTVKPLGGDDE
jgi:Holliday junction resolvase RusA-like endonuclease